MWRVRLPFDEICHPRNLITKLLQYQNTFEATNSLCHRGDFVAGCLNLWQKRVDPGIYNLTNPGALSARQMGEILGERFPGKTWSFVEEGGGSARSNCVLDSSKAQSAGANMRPVEDAFRRSVEAYWGVSEPQGPDPE